MRIPETRLEATVIDRPNRFVVTVNSDGREIRCHLHDPGRLKELIFPGARVLIRRAPALKTQYSITAAWNRKEWILTDSRFHSRIGAEFLPPDSQREVSLGRSRIDFFAGGTYIEVKGGTLLRNGRAYFPDAPTKRGAHHLKLLTEAIKEGKKAILLMLVFQPDAQCFLPNSDTDPVFASSLSDFISYGGEVFVAKFRFNRNGDVTFMGSITLCLG